MVQTHGRNASPVKSLASPQLVKAATERDNFLTPQAALEFGLIDKVMESRKEASKTDA